jgi:hypothetical protein
VTARARAARAFGRARATGRRGRERSCHREQRDRARLHPSRGIEPFPASRATCASSPQPTSTPSSTATSRTRSSASSSPGSARKRSATCSRSSSTPCCIRPASRLDPTCSRHSPNAHQAAVRAQRRERLLLPDKIEINDAHWRTARALRSTATRCRSETVLIEREYRIGEGRWSTRTKSVVRPGRLARAGSSTPQGAPASGR